MPSPTKLEASAKLILRTRRLTSGFFPVYTTTNNGAYYGPAHYISADLRVGNITWYAIIVIICKVPRANGTQLTECRIPDEYKFGRAGTWPYEY